MNNLKIILPAIIIIIIVCVVGALNIAKTQVPYTAQECNNVQVPYSDQVCQNIDYAYNVKQTACTQYVPAILFGLGSSPAQVTCTVNNLENKQGTFQITYGFLIAGTPIRNTENVGIYAMSSVSRSNSYNGQIQNCICEAVPPSYQSCQVVTRYRTETQCHDVTKYRTVSLWQSLFG
jgi:hypothetical protein